jgi:hypothetical protein
VRDTSWPHNDIDRFVLAALEARGLRPAPEADRATWLRRASLDLIGLPPAIADVDAFRTDDAPDAHARATARLLASPHYGERWARPWLDLARYADSNGYEKDRARSMWPWRDWVIAALNDDMPFDRFTIEQLAGDMLPHPTRAQLVATGFHRNTMLNEEGGIDVEEFRYAAVVDRLNTTATTWLGLTVACCQCHDHKYDRLTQREYFGLLALFDNTDDVLLEVDDAGVQAARDAGLAAVAALRRDLAARFPLPLPAAWQTLVPCSARAEGDAELVVEPDGSVSARGAAPERDAYTIESVLPAGTLVGLRIEALRARDAPEFGPGRTAHGNFVLSEVELHVSEGCGAWERVPLATVAADIEQAGYPAAAAIDDDGATGWGIHGRQADWRQDRAARCGLATPVRLGPDARARVVLRQDFGSRHTMARVRLSVAFVGNSADLGAARRAHFEERFATWRDREQARARAWQTVVPTAIRSAGGADYVVRDDGSIVAYGNNPDRDTTTLVLAPAQRRIGALRLDALPDPSLPASGPGRSVFFPAGGFTVSDMQVRVLAADGSTARPLRFAAAAASYAHAEHPSEHAIDDRPDTGWTNAGHVGRAQHLVLSFAEPLELAAAERLELTVAQHSIHNNNLGRFRLACTSEPVGGDVCASPSEVEALLVRGDQSDATEGALRQAFLAQAPELARARAEIEQRERELPQLPTTLALRERDAGRARQTVLRHRGEFTRPREVVAPGVPACLPPLPQGAPKNRLTFARWLVSGSHPLTARVVVNRTWEAFFGRGLVATVEDFGVRGDAPSHPELLDWLACELVARGWSMKALHALIVTSATYRQAAAVDPARFADDPDNRALARMSRLRLPAELVRDQALFAGGLLVPRLFGPSVFPPQPKGVGDVAYGQAAWEESKGDDRYRRGLYTFQKRTVPYVMHALFDAPSGEACVARRARSGTPLQALTLLNDAVFVEAAQGLARVVCRDAHDDVARVRLAVRRCLVRAPTLAEEHAMLAFVDQQRARLARGDLDARALTGAAPCGDPAEVAAWTALARVLLNLDETLVRG